MKILTTLFLLLFAMQIHSQTAIISVKSHSGSGTSYASADDNFGWIEPDPVYDTVIKLDESCIIVKGERWGGHRFQDSTCDHWRLRDTEITHQVLRSTFGEGIVIIDKTKTAKPGGGEKFWIYGGTTNYGGNIWVLLILLSLGLYIVVPVIKKRIS